MTSKSEWSNARRIVIILADVLLYNLSIILGFMVKFGREIPSFNFVAYENLQFTFQSFYLLNLLLGAYIFIIAKLVTSFLSR